MACKPTEIKSGKLLIPHQVNDNGVRPLSDREVYWTSPSIKLRGGIDEGTAKVGVENNVVVTVKNISNQPVDDINVEVWVCDFTLGMLTTKARPSSNPGGLPMTKLLTAPLTAVGSPGDHQDVIMDAWTPTPADATLNGGHLCIAVNCYSDRSQDGAMLATQGSEFKFLCDSHHAQRNIAVRDVSGGTRRVDLGMRIVNPVPELGNVTFAEIQKTTGRRAFTAGLRGLLRSRADVIYARIAPHISLTGDPYQRFARDMLQEEKDIETIGEEEHHEFEHYTADEARTFGLAPTRKRFFLAVDERSYIPLHFTRRLPQDFAIVSESFGRGRNLRFELREDQVTTVNISVDLQQRDQPGDMHAFDLVQRSPEGDVVGGARLITIVEP